MIKIICVGKIKEKFYVEAINEYKKRLTKYTKIEIIEVPDEQNNSLIKEKENITSETFSQFIGKTQIINPNITFIIGGSSGLHDEIKKISNYKISFSDMTFPHQLFRVILLEQVYRAYKILNNETYHK